MGINFVPCKHSFGAQIENNMLENHADQREMVILFFITFLYVVVTSKAIKSDFPSATDWLLDGSKEDEKLRYSVYHVTILVWTNVGLGVSSGFLQGVSTAQPKCFKHVVERKLSDAADWKESHERSDPVRLGLFISLSILVSEMKL